MSPGFRQRVSHYGILIILVGMLAGGLGYYLNPGVAKWVIMCVVVLLWLALIIKVVFQAARRSR